MPTETSSSTTFRLVNCAVVYNVEFGSVPIDGLRQQPLPRVSFFGEFARRFAEHHSPTAEGLLRLTATLRLFLKNPY